MIKISNLMVKLVEACGKQSLAEGEVRECLYRAVISLVGPRVEQVCRRVRKVGFLLMTVPFLAIVAIDFDRSVTAQSARATVLGRVTDEQGDAVSNAKVVAKNPDTGVTHETTTDLKGRYHLSNLLPGRYEISAEGQGFRFHIQRGVELTVGREALIDFKLSNTEEKSVIQQDASPVQTTNSALGTLVNTSQIERLPLNGRDILQLMTLAPGIVSASSIVRNQSDLGPGTSLPTINGGRIDFNAFLLDGTETADAFGYSPGGLSGGFLGVEAIREFQILTSGYPAEFGHRGGAVINAVTKSGTNQVHGTAFEFLRNSALDARNFFDRNPRQAPFQRNQFGGSLGGPLAKDRAFLFGSYEGLRRREGVPALFSVPSPAAKQGNLTAGQVTVAPSVQPYLALYPDPNGPIAGDTGLYRRDFIGTAREDFWTTRVDIRVSKSHSLAGRYTIDSSDSTQVGGIIQDLVLDNRNQYVALEEQTILGARGVNTLRGTYSRSNFKSDFPFSVNVDQSLTFIPGRRMGGFLLSGVSPLREAVTDGRHFPLNHFEVNDQFVYNLGAHSVKIGGSARRYQLNSNFDLIKDGIFIYTSPGGGLAQFLTGAPDVLFVAPPGTDYSRGIRQSLFSLYAQDNWKATRRLTLNLGARYEPISAPAEVNGKVANLRNIATDASPTVGAQFIDNPSLKNIAPRIGFALDVFGDGKTALRGAAGVFYSAIIPMRYRFEISNQPPFAQLSAVVGPFPNAFTSPIVSFPGGVIAPIKFDAEQPTVYQWNLNIQQELGRDLVLSASYVGSRGAHLETIYSLNVRTDFQIVNGQKFFPAISPDLVQAARFNPNFSSINYLDFSADSYYHSLQVNLAKRFSGGLQFQAAYTLSKSVDTASTSEGLYLSGTLGTARQDPFNSRAQRTLSEFDVRHNFVVNFLYDLPFGKGHAIGGDLTGAASKLVGGWTIGGIANLRSGFPLNVGLGFDRAGDGTDNAQAQRPNVAPGVNLSKAATGDPDGFVDPSFFQLQPAGFYGNAPRNALRGPDLKSFDMALTKRTAVTERLRTEFRVEAFNLFNRPNFALPDVVNQVIYTGVNATDAPILNPSFGQLTRTAIPSRQIQFGLKLIW